MIKAIPKEFTPYPVIAAALILNSCAGGPKRLADYLEKLNQTQIQQSSDPKTFAYFCGKDNHTNFKYRPRSELESLIMIADGVLDHINRFEDSFREIPQSQREMRQSQRRFDCLSNGFRRKNKMYNRKMNKYWNVHQNKNSKRKQR